jgi:fatty-acid desaturase
MPNINTNLDLQYQQVNMDNMFDDAGNIALAQCIFFGLVIVPAIYCLFTHGTRGLPGWIYVIIFCVMRVTGGAILLNSVTQNLGVTPAGLIVSSVAIAPLVMAVAGVAHET